MGGRIMSKSEFKSQTVFSFKSCSGAKRDCPNVILAGEKLVKQLEEIVNKNDLDNYLKKGNREGPILPHSKFKVGVAGCPNGCSKPQIRDLSILARVRPEIIEQDCINCGECVEVCKESAIELENDIAVIDYNLCLDCGDCIKVCPVDAIEAIEEGWSLAIGGKMGRHPQFATKLIDLTSTEEIIEFFPELIKFYQREREEKERLGLVLNKLSKEAVKERLNL